MSEQPFPPRATKTMTRVEEMRLTESNAISTGMTSSSLMENAGSAVADTIIRLKGKTGRVLVTCGPGKNGGDGLVVARKLLHHGYKVTTLLLVPPESLKPEETKSKWKEYESLGGTYFVADRDDWERRLETEIRACDLIVDAIFGTGIEGEISGTPAMVIDAVNSSGKLVFAVDTPSGLDPFTGRVAGKAVRAGVTVSFHAPKQGLISRSDLTGEVVVADIGIPKSASAFIEVDNVLSALLPRHRFTHKGDYGTVMVVGGSELYSGAPALAGLAALRAGAGLVFIEAPEAVAASIRSMSPDLIVRSLPGDRLRPSHWKSMRLEFERANVISIGPGLGRSKGSVGVALEIAKRALSNGKKLVIDADALDIAERIASTSSPTHAALTPHAGEFRRLTGQDVGDQWTERIAVAREFARSHNSTVLLKGYHTVISDGSRVKVHEGGNPGMSKGGMGDVLTGVLSGIMAQGSNAFEASCAAAFICAETADLLFASKGFHYVASDLVSALPEVLRKYDRYAD